MLVLADTGAIQILRSYFQKNNPVNGNNFYLKLFTNDINPADTDTAATYTEASGGGYVARTLVPADFDVAMVSGIATVTAGEHQFVLSGSLTGAAGIYGYFVVDSDGVLIHAERRPAGVYTPDSSGGIYSVFPQFQLSKGTPA